MASPGSADESVSRRIHAEQIRLLYAHAPSGAWASLFVALLLGFVLWQTVPRPVLSIWLILLGATIALRLALTAAFQRCPALAEAAQSWAARYT